MLDDRRKGILKPKYDQLLVDKLYSMSTISKQIAQFQDESVIDKVKSLMLDFLPLVAGGGALEAFVLEPGLYKRDSGNLGLGVGLR
jgi:hypothetical protein